MFVGNRKEILILSKFHWKKMIFQPWQWWTYFLKYLWN